MILLYVYVSLLHTETILFQFGNNQVRIVRHKNSQKMYALKYINKDKCMKMKATDNIIAERKLLMEIDYPFIW